MNDSWGYAGGDRAGRFSLLARSSLPNFLTVSRLVAVPVMAVLWLSGVDENRWFITAIFALAALSDLLDGWLARRANAVTRLGTMLDPIADKQLFIITVLLLVYSDVFSPWDTFAVVIIVMREVFIAGLREYAGTIGTKVAVSNLAKYKTVLQLVALGLLCPVLPDTTLAEAVNIAGRALLWLACLVTVWTGLEYARGVVKYASGRD